MQDTTTNEAARETGTQSLFSKRAMTDLDLDIWNEWLREKQEKLEQIKSTLSPDEDACRY